jgi:hypothetical protein
VKYDNGRFELVGRHGPEIRTFAEKGTVIPAGKTKKMLKGKTPISRHRGGRVNLQPGGTMKQQPGRWLPSAMAEALGFVPRGSWMLSRSMIISKAEWERDQARQNKLAIALARAPGGAPARPKAKKSRFTIIPATKGEAYPHFGQSIRRI